MLENTIMYWQDFKNTFMLYKKFFFCFLNSWHLNWDELWNWFYTTDTWIVYANKLWRSIPRTQESESHHQMQFSVIPKKCKLFV